MYGNFLNKTLSTLILAGILGGATPALAHSSSTKATSTLATSTSPQGKHFDRACMQTVIDARETALIAEWAAYTAGITSAYSARKATLHSAWDITDRKQRREAIRAAWRVFEKSMHTVRADWKKARHDAWQKFKKDRKSCKNSGDENESEESDR